MLDGSDVDQLFGVDDDRQRRQRHGAAGVAGTAATRDDGQAGFDTAAHQMADRARANIIAMMQGKELKPYAYMDYGSLVSMSRFSTVGSLMGNLMRGSMMVEGRMARFVYVSLYRMHQVALHGYIKTGLMMLVGQINRILRPRLKLH